MNKFKILLLTIIAVVVLVGCSNKETGYEINSDLVDIGDLGRGLDLVRDKNTGCIYIKRESGNHYSFSAYYDETGKVAGCGEENLDKSKYE